MTSITATHLTDVDVDDDDESISSVQPPGRASGGVDLRGGVAVPLARTQMLEQDLRGFDDDVRAVRRHTPERAPNPARAPH